MTASAKTPAAGLTLRPAAGTKPLPAHGTLRRAMGDRRYGWPRCHCKPCRTTERRYSKRRSYLTKIGKPILVDATPTREHLANLRAAGDAFTGISAQYGIPRRTLNQIFGGQWKRVHAETASRILAIPPGTATNNYRSVPAVGAVRRIRALIAAGHTMNAVAAAMGLQHSTASLLLNGRQDTIRHELNERVKSGYVALASSSGNAVRSLLRAQREGWRDPLWWEDMGHIDDPTFDPATAEQELSRNEQAALRRAEVDHLSAFGFVPEVIAERLDMHVSTVRAIVAELRTGERRNRKAAA
ncbi:hypothetical protein [Streptomyces sp. NPDC056543]|uniref:hypothetical protein n=1 Tax=unclassified Streptomyces TaxID=2593676 RepID=UPI003691BD7E